MLRFLLIFLWLGMKSSFLFFVKLVVIILVIVVIVELFIIVMMFFFLVSVMFNCLIVICFIFLWIYGVLLLLFCIIKYFLICNFFVNCFFIECNFESWFMIFFKLWKMIKFFLVMVILEEVIFIKFCVFKNFILLCRMCLFMFSILVSVCFLIGLEK